jgi:sphingosine kinase
VCKKRHNLIRYTVLFSDGKILVIVNPKSGVGKAREMFQNKVVPILTEADISYDLHVTTASGEARGFVTSQVLEKYLDYFMKICTFFS